MNREPGRFISWRQRLGLSFLCAIPIMILTVFFDYQLRQVILHSNLVHLQQTADSLRNTIRHQFDFVVQSRLLQETHRADRLKLQIDQLHQFLSGMVVVFTERSLPREQIQQSFLSMIRKMKDSTNENYILVDTTGRIIFHPDLPSGSDISGFPYFQEMLSKEAGSVRYRMRVTPDDPEEDEVIAFRIFKPWNWIIGISLQNMANPSNLADIKTTGNSTTDGSDTISMAWLSDLIHSIHHSKSGFALIELEDGQVVTCSDESGLSTNPVPGFLEQLGTDAGLEHCLDSARQKWWIVTLHFPPKRWTIRVASPESDFLIPYYEKRPLICTALLASYLLILVLIYLLTEKHHHHFKQTTNRQLYE